MDEYPYLCFMASTELIHISAALYLPELNLTAHCLCGYIYTERFHPY